MRKTRAKTTFRGKHIRGDSLRSSEIRRRNELRRKYEFQKISRQKNASQKSRRVSKVKEDHTIIGMIILGICYVIAKVIEYIAVK
jgi:hypothetical protein